MPAAQNLPAEVGNEAGGFRFAGSPSAALRVQVWGYWPPEVASAFGREAMSACQLLTPDSAFTLEASELKPQGGEGQEALRVMLRALSALSFAKGTIIAANTLTRMQLTRLLRECGMDERLSFGESFSRA